MTDNRNNGTRVIRFDDGERAAEPVASAGTSRIEPVAPAAQPRVDTGPAYRAEPRVEPQPVHRAEPERKRNLLPWLAGAAALSLGVAAALMLSPRDDDIAGKDGQTTITETQTTRTETQTAETGAAAAAGAAARGPYRDPDAESVERALLGVRTDFEQGGASAVQRQSQACFDSLARTPGYTELDYCLAYDAYGAALAKRLAQGQPLPEGSWFAGTEARAIRTTQAVLGGQGDPAARLLDIRRLTVQVAADNPARSGESRTQVAQAPERVEVRPSAPSIAPEPPRAAPAPRPPEPRVAPRPVEPRFEPRPVEPAPPPVQRAAVGPAPVGSARPSFNCRNARSTSERMVCSDPVLAAADWRLHNVFERAWANTSDRRALRAEQDRWLQAREGAAPDPQAVLQVYETRIDELAAAY